jgi:hypothetical protein
VCDVLCSTAAPSPHAFDGSDRLCLHSPLLLRSGKVRSPTGSPPLLPSLRQSSCRQSPRFRGTGIKSSWGPRLLKRGFGTHATVAAPVRSIEPPATHLTSFDFTDLVSVDQYASSVCLLRDLNRNPLISPSGSKAPYDFTPPFQSLAQQLIELVIRNANRGYCMTSSFTWDNVMICRRYNQVHLYEPLVCGIDESDPLRTRSASMQAARSFLIDLLEKSAGPKIWLSANACDVIFRMNVVRNWTHECKLVFLPCFLSAESQASLVLKIHRLCKAWQDGDALSYGYCCSILGSMAKTYRFRCPWQQTASRYPLLSYTVQITLNHAEERAIAKGMTFGGIKYLSLLNHIRHVVIHGLDPNGLRQICLQYSFEEIVQC